MRLKWMQNILNSENVLTSLLTLKKIGLHFAKKEKKRTGRRKATTKRDDRWIKFAARRDKKEIQTNLAKEIKISDRKTLSRKTITRKLKENGIMSKIRAKKPLLSQNNVKNKLYFRAEYYFDTKWFRIIIWSNESRFCLYNILKDQLRNYYQNVRKQLLNMWMVE